MFKIKKLVFAFLVLLAFFSYSVFAQTEDNESSKSNINLSLINENFLIHSTEYFSKSSYQTPSGKSVSHKEATALFLSEPESAIYVKQYKNRTDSYWRRTSWWHFNDCRYSINNSWC